jgi:hypothetical protein
MPAGKHAHNKLIAEYPKNPLQFPAPSSRILNSSKLALAKLVIQAQRQRHKKMGKNIILALPTRIFISGMSFLSTRVVAVEQIVLYPKQVGTRLAQACKASIAANDYVIQNIDP